MRCSMRLVAALYVGCQESYLRGAPPRSQPGHGVLRQPAAWSTMLARQPAGTRERVSTSCAGLGTVYRCRRRGAPAVRPAQLHGHLRGGHPERQVRLLHLVCEGARRSGMLTSGRSAQGRGQRAAHPATGSRAAGWRCGAGGKPARPGRGRPAPLRHLHQAGAGQAGLWNALQCTRPPGTEVGSAGAHPEGHSSERLLWRPLCAGRKRPTCLFAICACCSEYAVIRAAAERLA